MIDQLTPGIILSIIVAYFLLLIGISFLTSKSGDNATFFLAGRKSPWFVVAFGMIGASLSGVTFISIPGVVGAGGENQAFSYMQMVFGYLLGYLFIATVLMPLYYRLNLTSIYAYLKDRFGFFSYKTGSGFFLLSRTIGAAFRLYLVAIILQQFVLGPFGIPFEGTVITTILLIWIYTFRGGIGTIIWTDTLQTTFMLTAVILTIISISGTLDLSLTGMITEIRQSDYSQVFFFDEGWRDPNNFFKQFLSGALITIVMTGLDQDMMQKNLSCPTIWDAQKNMFSFSLVLVFANLLFLTLGALLYIYADQVGLVRPAKSDQLFPTIALQHLSPAVGVIFILGLIAAAYSSADSALTALTTSFCVDFLGFEEEQPKEEQALKKQKRTRFLVHLGFSTILLIIIIIFNSLTNKSVINELFTWAGYTYGPLLGLYAFGLFTRLKVRDPLVLPICIIAPVLSYIINTYAPLMLDGFELGFLIIAINGLITFVGLLIISYREYELVEE